MTATSIDYGIMEKTDHVVCFSMDCGWDDLGSWISLQNLSEKWNMTHPAGVLASGECLALNSKGNIVDATGRLVALMGVNNLIVVAQNDVILVANKENAQDLRKLVGEVKKIRPDLV